MQRRACKCVVSVCVCVRREGGGVCVCVLVCRDAGDLKGGGKRRRGGAYVAGRVPMFIKKATSAAHPGVTHHNMRGSL